MLSNIPHFPLLDSRGFPSDSTFGLDYMLKLEMRSVERGICLIATS